MLTGRAQGHVGIFYINSVHYILPGLPLRLPHVSVSNRKTTQLERQDCVLSNPVYPMQQWRAETKIFTSLKPILLETDK